MAAFRHDDVGFADLRRGAGSRRRAQGLFSRARCGGRKACAPCSARPRPGPSAPRAADTPRPPRRTPRGRARGSLLRRRGRPARAARPRGRGPRSGHGRVRAMRPRPVLSLGAREVGSALPVLPDRERGGWPTKGLGHGPQDDRGGLPHGRRRDPLHDLSLRRPRGATAPRAATPRVAGAAARASGRRSSARPGPRACPWWRRPSTPRASSSPSRPRPTRSSSTPPTSRTPSSSGPLPPPSDPCCSPPGGPTKACSARPSTSSPARPSALLHGPAAAPASLEELRLRELRSLKERHGVPVGFLDATDGGGAFALLAPALAAAHGADFVEKRFTLDRSEEGPRLRVGGLPRGLLSHGRAPAAGGARAGRSGGPAEGPQPARPAALHRGRRAHQARRGADRAPCWPTSALTNERAPACPRGTRTG